MPGRSFNAGNKYRYGFNGQEDDKDINAGAQDYGMRIYDARIAKFLSVDPITKKYPELTPYQFASNTPLRCTDLDGKEADWGILFENWFVGFHQTASTMTDEFIKNESKVVSRDGMGNFDQTGTSGTIQDQVDNKNINSAIAQAKVTDITAQTTTAALNYAMLPYKFTAPEMGIIEAPFDVMQGDYKGAAFNLIGGVASGD